ncbi:DUF3429 domain-containing protein [Fodinicurvata fenggangensis]|uniref:DUF3429 domain-containing protein n=1 Tax=Fodinicurvata fenggangensis TaxID=1121830 RepID=UPI0004791EA2|nr:DUF3429 domain-containing protein [Fodinicurvata fenggangensis]
MTLAQLPRPALVLGFAGLLPFVAGSLAVWFLPMGWNDYALFIQMAYAAVILSFLGAIHWGLALAGTGTEGSDRDALTWKRLGWSVVPALLGWFALVMTPVPGLILMILSFFGILQGDVLAVRRGQAPVWYIALRRPLTAAVILCLGLSLIRVLL